MPIIQSGRNRVAADDPEPADTHVQVVWFGPATEDGQRRKVFEGLVEPVENYEAVVAWAVEMASQMVYPLYVVPMTGVDVLRTDEVRDAVADLTDQQRGKLRQLMVTTLANVMRDCDDPAVRADAYEVLQQMKVVQP